MPRACMLEAEIPSIFPCTCLICLRLKIDIVMLVAGDKSQILGT